MFKLYVIIGCIIGLPLLFIDMFDGSTGFMLSQILIVGTSCLLAWILNSYIDEKIDRIKNKKG